MTQDNQVVLISTTTCGFLYNVYPKDDLERKKLLYMGEISEEQSQCSCTCIGFSLLKKCYHQRKAFEIMEIKI